MRLLHFCVTPLVGMLWHIICFYDYIIVIKHSWTHCPFMTLWTSYSRYQSFALIGPLSCHVVTPPGLNTLKFVKISDIFWGCIPHLLVSLMCFASKGYDVKIGFFFSSKRYLWKDLTWGSWIWSDETNPPWQGWVHGVNCHRLFFLVGAHTQAAGGDSSFYTLGSALSPQHMTSNVGCELLTSMGMWVSSEHMCIFICMCCCSECD